MSLPKIDKKHYEKDRLDRAIDDFAGLENPTIKDLSRVEVVTQVLAGLNTYRARAMNMTPEELEDEIHNSARLAGFMAASGNSRPHSLCHAHAIISGGHTGAARARTVLAWFQRRIDDPINGCWLPCNTAAKPQMPKYLSKAVPHSRIHRKGYYRWLQGIVNLVSVKTDQDLQTALKMITLKLQNSTFPGYVMLPAHQVPA